MRRRGNVEQGYTFQLFPCVWIIGRGEWGIHGCQSSAYGVVVAEGGDTCVIIRYLCVHVGTDPVVELRIEVDASEHLLVAGTHAQSVLTQSAARQIVSHGRCAACHGDVGSVHRCRLVNIFIPFEVGLLEIFVFEGGYLVGSVNAGLLVVSQQLRPAHQLVEIVGVSQRRHRILCSDVDGRTCFRLSVLCGDVHDTVGRTRTVDRRGCGILEELHALDVVGVHRLKYRHADLHSVHDDEQACPGSQRPLSVQGHGQTGGRLT